MQVGPLVALLEVVRALEVPLHHVDEPIVVFHGAPRILHQQRSGLPQAPADSAAQGAQLGTELGARVAGDGEVRREIYDGEVHYLLAWRVRVCHCDSVSEGKLMGMNDGGRVSVVCGFGSSSCFWGDDSACALFLDFGPTPQNSNDK